MLGVVRSIGARFKGSGADDILKALQKKIQDPIKHQEPPHCNSSNNCPCLFWDGAVERKERTELKNLRTCSRIKKLPLWERSIRFWQVYQSVKLGLFPPSL